jgi:hypothetical protein
MNTSKGRESWLLLALVAGFLVIPTATARAQNTGNSGPPMDGPVVYGLGNGVSTSHDPRPYDGQIYCPVTGAKLAADGSAIAVQTTIGEVKPTRKFFGAKASPGMVIYVCCPECEKKVKSNPQLYAAEVIADHATLSFTFADAPAQRPGDRGVKPRAQVRAD